MKKSMKDLIKGFGSSVILASGIASSIMGYQLINKDKYGLAALAFVYTLGSISSGIKSKNSIKTASNANKTGKVAGVIASGIGALCLMPPQTAIATAGAFAVLGSGCYAMIKIAPKLQQILNADLQKTR